MFEVIKYLLLLTIITLTTINCDDVDDTNITLYGFYREGNHNNYLYSIDPFKWVKLNKTNDLSQFDCDHIKY